MLRVLLVLLDKPDDKYIINEDILAIIYIKLGNADDNC